MYSTFSHSSTSLSELSVQHLPSGRVFLNTALFKYVYQCGFRGCNKFHSRNNLAMECERKFRSHWIKDHPEAGIDKFKVNKAKYFLFNASGRFKKMSTVI